MKRKTYQPGYEQRQRIREHAFILLEKYDPSVVAYVLYRDYDIALPKARIIVRFVQSSLRRIKQ